MISLVMEITATLSFLASLAAWIFIGDAEAASYFALTAIFMLLFSLVARRR